MQPKFIMLIGVPACGKSTWVKENVNTAITAVVSTDSFIDLIAETRNKTYNEVFKDTIKFATELSLIAAKNAFLNNRDIVWDQTNLTVKSRKSKIQMVPKNYYKEAIWFETPPHDEHIRRLNSRNGKSIPSVVIKSMVSSFQIPSLDEGFDNIVRL